MKTEYLKRIGRTSRKVIDFSKGYKSSFYGMFVDPKSWEDTDRFEIKAGTITRNDDDLRQSASLTIKEYDETTDRWIRIYMLATQNGNSSLVPLFTGLASSPNFSYTAGVYDSSLECYSVLKAVSDLPLPKGWYVPAGSVSTDILYELLSRGPAPISIEGANTYPILDSSIIAESKESNLSMALKIINAIGWRLQISPEGTVIISPDLDNPVEILSYSDNDVIENNFKVTRDWFNCPNVYEITYEGETYSARDDDPESDLSIATRGREIYEYEDSPTLTSSDTPQSYVEKKLYEAQTRSEVVEYDRRYLPTINQDDLISIDYPNLSGEFYVTSQTITLGPNARTGENVMRYV